MGSTKTTTILLLWAIFSAGCASAGRTAAWEKQTPAAAASSGDAAAIDVPAQMSAADVNWSRRDDRAELDSAINRWEAVVRAEPENADALTKLSRAYYFLVDGHFNTQDPVPEDLDDLKLKFHEKGADYGERALILVDPTFGKSMREGGDFIETIGKIEKPAVPAAYWYCTNLGRFAVAKGLSAKLFYKDRVSSAMHRVKAIAPDFFYAAADRYLGAFYSALPSIAGKDVDKSRVHFEEATKNAPEYLGNFVVKAEFLAVELDDRAMYEALLKQVIEGADGDDPNVAAENRAAKRTAQKLLTEEQIDERF